MFANDAMGNEFGKLYSAHPYSYGCFVFELLLFAAVFQLETGVRTGLFT